MPPDPANRVLFNLPRQQLSPSFINNLCLWGTYGRQSAQRCVLHLSTLGKEAAPAPLLPSSVESAGTGREFASPDVWYAGNLSFPKFKEIFRSVTHPLSSR